MEYKVLKKFGDYKKGDVLVVEGGNFSDDELASGVEAGQLKLIDKGDTLSPGPAVHKTSKPVVFTLRDRNSAVGKKERVFSEEEHGEGYADLADQFEKANQSEILHRE